MRAFWPALSLLLVSFSLRAQTIPITRPRPNLLVGGVGIAASPPVLNLTLAQAGLGSSAGLTVTTTLGALGIANTLVLTAYFATTSALTTSAGDVVLSSEVQAACATCLSTGYAPFTQSSAYAPASSLALVNSSTLLTLLGGSRTDVLQLRIDLSSAPQTPAGSYTGTLILAAQIF